MIWPRFRIPAPVVQIALVAVLAYVQLSKTLYWWGEQSAAHIASQQDTWSVISQMRESAFRPRPRSSVLFLEDPFEDWRTLFISQLVWDDHSVDIAIARRLPSKLTQAEIDRYASVLTIENGRVKVVRP